MKLYAEYLMEREGKHLLERPEGFCTYTFTPNGCYIVDIYVRPEHRKSGVASELASEVARIAKAEGAKALWGTVVPTANGSTASVKTLLAYGFSVHSSQDNFIIFRKDI